MNKPMMSGHCSTPSTDDPKSSHDRCERNGAGSRANPKKEFTPCPCKCHQGETYECGACGRPIVEMPACGTDEDGDPYYFHVDSKTGLAANQFCA